MYRKHETLLTCGTGTYKWLATNTLPILLNFNQKNFPNLGVKESCKIQPEPEQSV